MGLIFQKSLKESMNLQKSSQAACRANVEGILTD